MAKRLILILTLLVAGAVQLVPQSAPQVSAFGIIQGTVTRDGTTEPIADVQITVNVAASGAQTSALPLLLTAVSDSAGHFVIKNIPVGAAVVRVQRDGYFAPAGKGSGIVKVSSTPSLVTINVTVSAEQTMNVHPSMILGGAISGRILDPEGKPVSNMPVEVLRLDYQPQNGIPTLRDSAQQTTAQTTDDRGEYRLSRLAPGDYFLAASPPLHGGVPELKDASSAAREALITTLFPSATDVSSAVPISLRGGDELTGMNIQVKRVPTFEISGHIVSTLPPGPVSGRGGQPRSSVADISLVPREETFNMSAPYKSERNGFSANPDDGSFEIPNVPAGTYDLYARLPMAPFTGWGGGNSPDKAGAPWAIGKTTVSVTGTNLENVTVVVRPGTDVKGRVILDGKPAAAARFATYLLDYESLRMTDLALSGVTGVFSQISNFRPPIGEDGSFTLPLLPEGHYRFAYPAPYPGPTTVSGVPAYIADIRQGGFSVYDNGLRVESDPVNPIDMILNTNGGSIEGIVAGADQKPIPGMDVVLVPPENRRQNPALYKTAQTNALGHFVFTNLAPGQYKLFSWESVQENAYKNAEFLSRYEARGVPVAVTAGARTNAAEVRLIPVDASKR